MYSTSSMFITILSDKTILHTLKNIDNKKIFVSHTFNLDIKSKTASTKPTYKETNNTFTTIIADKTILLIALLKNTDNETSSTALTSSTVIPGASDQREERR